MRAIKFNATIPRYLVGITLSKAYPPILWSGLSCTAYAEVPDPRLPGEDWTVVRTRLGGICGTDTSTIFLKTSPYFTPLTSMPHIIGHENVGRLALVGKQPAGWQAGDRVVVEPILWCRPRGFKELCRFCARGEINRCERMTQGDLAPGPISGTCRDTGGSWAPYFLAHRSQLYRVPEHVSDENALMIEPLAVSLHAALQNYPRDEDRVLIAGAGSIGLCTLAALRGLGSQAEIVVLARYGFQAEAARRLGASEVVMTDRESGHFEALAEVFGASVRRPILGKKIVLGGADVTFECVGSDSSIDDCLRLTRNGGKVVLVGVPGIARGVDWSAIFAQELEVKAASYYHHAERFKGKKWKTFDLAIHLLASGAVDLAWMVTHRFPLHEYHRAFDLTHRRAAGRALKIVFEFPE